MKTEICERNAVVTSLRKVKRELQYIGFINCMSQRPFAYTTNKDLKTDEECFSDTNRR
jgi:hypothetical protein